MTTETLYTPRGSGHRTPGREPRRYGKPRDELLGAFGEYLRRVNEIRTEDERLEDEERKCRNSCHLLYRAAWDTVSSLDHVSAEEAEALITLMEGHPDLGYGGMFLSAVWYALGQKEIVFDLETEDPLWGLGYCLPRDRNLVLWAQTSKPGIRSAGTIVNFSRAIDSIARRMKGGTILNYGESGGYLGLEAPEGIVIDCGKSWLPAWSQKSGIVVLNRREDSEMFTRITWDRTKNLYLHGDECDRVPGLVDYLEGLKERLGPARGKVAVLQELKGLDIEADIKGILTASGHWPLPKPKKDGILKRIGRYFGIVGETGRPEA